MSIILVPDPTYKGSGVAPQLPRAWAMRKMHEAGASVGDVARHFDVPYPTAYKAIQPTRAQGGSPKSKAAKPLTKKRVGEMNRTQLEKIAYMKQAQITTPAIQARVQAAADELERRGLL